MSRQNNKCKAQEENNMCRKLVVTNEIFLGARPICYEAYSLPKGEVVELTEKQIPLALSQLARFIDNPLSTVTGQKAQRKQKIEKLQSYGYDVNEKNFQSFVDFMELLSQQAIDLQYDSEAVVELWEATRDKVSPATIAKDLDSWLENRFSISKLPDIASKDAEEILRLLKE